MKFWSKKVIIVNMKDFATTQILFKWSKHKIFFNGVDIIFNCYNLVFLIKDIFDIVKDN